MGGPTGKNIISAIIRVGESATRYMMWICLTALMAMMAITTLDVFGRYFLNRPVRGALEFTEFLLVISVAAGLGYTQVVKGNIVVDLAVKWLPAASRRVVYAFGNLVCLVLYVLITWQSLAGAQTQWRNSVTSGAYEIPLWPFYAFLALGCGVVSLVFLADLLKSIAYKEEMK